MARRRKISRKRPKGEYWAVGGSFGRKEFEIASSNALDFLKQWNDKFFQNKKLKEFVKDGKLFRENGRRKKR